MSDQNQNVESFSYDDKIVKLFIHATLFWGAAAMLAGVYIAFELAYWKLNGGIEWLTFGRLRPLHTNAAIFAFVGNSIFGGIYYSLQRLCKTRVYSSFLAKAQFWMWQILILTGGLSLLMGYSHGKEYAELEWPFDIAIAVIWVMFGVNVFGTIKQRREKHLYVAIWFYIATIITVAVLHIVNSIEIPVSLMKSYPVYTGVQDALVQWWYGHNAVAFFLTTPVLGLMYYFIPKASGRPVYSYRLSIVHFWSLVFIYIWAGPHHLLYSTLPDWAQTAGMVFSLMLWAPSWGGMINGLLTLRGAWDKVRQEPVLKFMATAVTFYGMSTFEGPMLSIKTINYMAHFTDWIVGHVHSGTIGWNYMMAAGILLYLVPKIWKTQLYSKSLANRQYWMATIGLVLYIISMYVAALTQGGMWRDIDEAGRLVYPNFVESVTRIIPMYWVRAIGGTMVLSSFLMMIVNLYKTMGQAKPKKDEQEDIYQASSNLHSNDHETGHRKLEGMSLVFSILAFLAIAVGSSIEIIPALVADNFIERSPHVKPYTPLEVAGRDIYIKEGCYVCHSQMIRPSTDEFLRYGEPSSAAETVYDRPFQWGSRRIGPDIARIGGKYPDMWHYRHMINPRDVTPNSIMPNYDWLIRKKTNFDVLSKKLAVMKSLGVPYTYEEVENAANNALEQAKEIANRLEEAGVSSSIKNKEIVALIAYLQRLGKDMKGKVDPRVKAQSEGDTK